MIDLDALDAAALNRDPFDYFVVPEFLKPEALAAANADYPEISAPGNHEPDAGRYGPAFGVLLDELRNPNLAARVGAKFGVDLSNARLSITIRRHCESTDGHVHTDHRTKVVTMLVYLNEGWTARGGDGSGSCGPRISKITRPRWLRSEGRCWRSFAVRGPIMDTSGTWENAA